MTSSSEQRKLAGQVILVTGAGRGIGKALAQGFAQAGADVALTARTAAELEQTAQEIRSIGRRVLAVPADVSDPAAVNRLVKTVLAEFEQIDILINNAGRQTPVGPLVENDPQKERVRPGHRTVHSANAQHISHEE